MNEYGWKLPKSYSADKDRDRDKDRYKDKDFERCLFSTSILTGIFSSVNFSITCSGVQFGKKKILFDDVIAYADFWSDRDILSRKDFSTKLFRDGFYICLSTYEGYQTDIRLTYRFEYREVTRLLGRYLFNPFKSRLFDRIIAGEMVLIFKSHLLTFMDDYSVYVSREGIRCDYYSEIKGYSGNPANILSSKSIFLSWANMGITWDWNRKILLLPDYEGNKDSRFVHQIGTADIFIFESKGKGDEAIYFSINPFDLNCEVLFSILRYVYDNNLVEITHNPYHK